MSFDPQEFDRGYGGGSAQAQQGQTIGQYTAKTFLWMFLGLLVTFGISLGMFMTGAIRVVYSIPGIHFGLLIAELLVVIVLSARIQKMSVTAARLMFFLYAALNGVVFTTFLVAYGLGSVLNVFGLTALYFGALAIFGYVTKADLSSIRSILFSGLIFLIIMGFLSMFFPMSQFETIICLIGIAIFLGYTAYDTKKIRAYYEYYAGDREMLERASIFSALQLYLDFINLFVYLLRILNKRR